MFAGSAGYQETDYLEPHDNEQFVEVGYHGQQELDQELQGGHGFHLPRSSFHKQNGLRGTRSRDQRQGSQADVARLYRPAGRPSSGYDPDGFGSLGNRFNRGAAGYSGGSPLAAGQSSGYTGEQTGQYGSAGKSPGAGQGYEDVHGIEAAAEASVEEQIENDER